jgi:hypothetical protein
MENQSTAEYLNTLCSYLNAIAADEAPSEVYSLLGQGKTDRPDETLQATCRRRQADCHGKCGPQDGCEMLGNSPAGRAGRVFHATPTRRGQSGRHRNDTTLHVALLKALHPDWVFLQIDFANAFNSISRSHCLKEVSTHFRHLRPFLHSIYAPTSKLWLNLKSGKTHLLK